MEHIPDRKFKASYVQITKFDNFRKIRALGYPCFNIHKTGITEPSDDLGIKVKANLMLNDEPKTLCYFLCNPTHDLVYLGPVFPNCPII